MTELDVVLDAKAALRRIITELECALGYRALPVTLRALEAIQAADALANQYSARAEAAGMSRNATYSPTFIVAMAELALHRARKTRLRLEAQCPAIRARGFKVASERRVSGIETLNSATGLETPRKGKS